MTNITVKIEDVKLKSDTITAKGQVYHQNELRPFYVEYTIGDNQTKVSFGWKYVSEKFEQALKEVVKNNALSQIYPTLIGRRMRGFVFDSGKYNDLGYFEEMDAYIGKEGIIMSHSSANKAFSVKFEDGTCRYYPDHLVLSCLVPEVYFPELPIGTLCWVWSDDKNVRYKRYVIGKKNGVFVTWYEADTEEKVLRTLTISHWKNAEPIITKEISAEEAEKMLSELTKEEFKIV